MDEALEVICAINDLPPDDPYVVSEMESIRQVLALEQNEGAQKWTSVFKTDVLQTRRRVGLAWFGLFMNQLSGINLGRLARIHRHSDLEVAFANEFFFSRLLPSIGFESIC